MVLSPKGMLFSLHPLPRSLSLGLREEGHQTFLGEERWREGWRWVDYFICRQPQSFGISTRSVREAPSPILSPALSSTRSERRSRSLW
jgi:hypothetical protein